MEELFLPLTKHKDFNTSRRRKIYISKFFHKYNYDADMEGDIVVEENLDDIFVRTANCMIEEIDERLSYLLGGILNDVHGTKFSMEFWKKILNSSWLHPILHSVYYKYYRIKYVFDNYKMHPIEVALLATNKRMTLKDVTEYTIRSETDAYDFQIWSRIVEKLYNHYENINVNYVIYGKNSAREEEALKKQFEGVEKSIRTSFTHRITKRLQRAVSLFRQSEFHKLKTFIKKTLIEEMRDYNKAKCYLYYPGFDAALFERLVACSDGMIFPLPRRSVNKRIYNQIAINQNLRKEVKKRVLDKLCMDKDRYNIVQIVLEEIPVCFLEAFHKIRMNYEPYLNENIKYIISQHGTYHNTAFMIFAAEMHDLYGTELRGIQHGGNYQIQHCLTGDAFLSDKMYCWGKSNLEGYFIPSAPYKLKQYKMEKEVLQKEIGILYIGDYCPRYLWRFTRPDFSENLVEERTSFFSSIKESFYDKMVVRLLKQYEYWNTDSLLVEKFPWIKIDNMQHDFYYMLNISKCCVTEIMGTTWLEGLISGTPTFIRFDGEWPVRESEMVYLNKLQEIGILHKDLTSIALLLNDVFGQIDLWWNEKERQEVVKTVVDRYWNDFGNPDIWWEEEILSLVKQ